jgi:chemotaxis protein methyltransferase CheR
MRDSDCIDFLQWALPCLDLRWPGFRKVRGQVCKRIKRRMRRLGIQTFAAYRERLGTDSEEWRVLDACCHVTISRFFRDKVVFDALRTRILPDIAARARRDRRNARCWSAGCASGEEPYSLKILWDLDAAIAFPDVALSIVATDIDDTVLERARRACYARTSLRQLPPDLIPQAFDILCGRLCVRPRHRHRVNFLRQDLRSQAPDGLFDLLLCRNAAFTYFAEPLQRLVLTRILERLLPHGYLIIGAHERLPEGTQGLVRLGCAGIFRREAAPECRGGRDGA